MRIRWREKARIVAILRRARAGELDARAGALMAHRVRIGRLIAGHTEEASAEAEAGALLEAETAHLIQRICEKIPVPQQG